MARPTSRPKTEISVAVTHLRERLDLTQEQLAARLRISPVTVARWETTHPPRGAALEKLLRFAKRNGAATSADTFLRQITREKSDEYGRYRMAEILDEGNVQDLRVLLRDLWTLEASEDRLDPVRDADRREYLLKFADRLFLGGRTEFLGEAE